MEHNGTNFLYWYAPAKDIEKAAADISTLARLAGFELLADSVNPHAEPGKRANTCREFLKKARAALAELETLCNDEPYNFVAI